MTAAEHHHRKRLPKGGIVAIVIALVTLMTTGAVMVIGKLVTDDGSKRKRQIQMVTLVKPPEPPKIKEKPPEPEPEVKKEEVVEQQQEEQPQEEPADDQPPAGEDLGVDAEGSGGGDAFGLVGKKGGRSLIGGNGGGSAFAWYTRNVVNSLQELVNKIIRERGGVPDKRLKVEIEIRLDALGNIVSSKILSPSGNKLLDEVVLEAARLAAVNEPPPSGMPRILKFRISPKG
ncbi:MAG: cell envelope integrity protein TolA [Thermodesulfobacteriota bacterium]